MCMKKKNTKTTTKNQQGASAFASEGQDDTNPKEKTTIKLPFSNESSDDYARNKQAKNNEAKKNNKNGSPSHSNFGTEQQQMSDNKKTGGPGSADEVVGIISIKPGAGLESAESLQPQTSRKPSTKTLNPSNKSPMIALKKCASFERVTTEDNKSKEPIQKSDKKKPSSANNKAATAAKKAPTKTRTRGETMSTNLMSDMLPDQQNVGKMEELSREPVAKNMKIQKQKFPLHNNNMDTLTGATSNFSSSLGLNDKKKKTPVHQDKKKPGDKMDPTQQSSF